MTRSKRWAANTGLILASVLVVLVFVKIADVVVGVRNPPAPIQEDEGVIFQPGGAVEYDLYDYQTVERINSLGFRDNEVPLESEHAIRILAVGDSFTYGWGVNLEETWCKQLEKNLRDRGIDAEVLNLGRPAAGPNQYVEIVQQGVARLNPDFVLIGLLTADDLQQIGDVVKLRLGDTARNFFPNIVRVVQDEAQERQIDMIGGIPMRTAEQSREFYISVAKDLVENMTPEQREHLNSLEPKVQQVFHEGGLNPWMLMHSAGGPDYFLYMLEESGIRWRTDNLKILLERIRTIAEAGGAKVMMLGIPEGFIVNDEAYENVQRIGFQMLPEIKTSTLLDEMVEETSTSVGIPFVSAVDAMRANHRKDKGLYLELDRHMAPKGNKVFADIVTPAVADFIEAER